jgi:two-component system, OmpR family, phosphate regulon sensor histidine kinase PhoR
MTRHSFFARLLLGDLLLIALLVGVGGVVAYQRINQTYLTEKKAGQERLLEFAQHYLEQLWAVEAGRVDVIDRDCKRLMVGSPMRLTVIADDGRVLGDSDPLADPRKMHNHKTPDRPEVLDALAGRPGEEIRASETLSTEFRYLALPIHHEGKIVGVVRLAMPIVAILQGEGLIRSALVAAAVAAAAAAGMLALLLSWLWYAPLRQIARTARTLASGDLTGRASIAGSGELAQLASALNEMRDHIALRMDQVAAQRQNLVAVIENLQEGVIALDSQGRIILMNRSAIELLAANAESVAGQRLQAVVRVAGIVDVYNAVIQAAGPISRQLDADIRGKRCILEVHASRLAEGSAENLAALLVVRDVTGVMRMAAVKAEFVANASHELRTPLATIRAAVDSLTALEPGATEEFRRITQILDRHTTRLQEMTNDLLNLHLLESNQLRVRREPISLGDLAAWVSETFAARAAGKGIRLAVECPDARAQLRSDPSLVQLILQNLLDNAVKFTAAGEVLCRLEIAPAAGGALFTVRDTGCGIAPDMQGRVFERFFQADASRSGEPRIRGTGLGLAIVKHACERLAATVKLQGELGKGTTVTVAVPQLAE